MKALRLTNTQKWFALAVIITAMYIAFWSGLGTQPYAPAYDEGADMPSTQTFALVDLQNDATAQETDALLKAANEALTQAPAAIEAASEQTVVAEALNTEAINKEAWQVDNHRAPTPSIPLHERIVDYTVVELTPPTSFPQVGESVVLPMLKGEKVVASVESVVTNPNGDYTWRGHLQGHGDSYPVVMTYGATSVMATITTPAGSYSMTTVKGLGWLYKNPAEVELVDALQNDFLEPPMDHYHDEH